MRKAVLCMLLTLVSLCGLFSGCSSASSPRQAALGQAEIIMECIRSRDGERLKQVMSPRLLAEEDVDSQIADFLNFFEGTIRSCSDPLVRKGEGKIRNGAVTEQQMYGAIDNVQTDTGKCYLIEFRSVHTDVKNPDAIGVYFISVREGNDASRSETICISALLE